jgi:hypothetical protein
MTSAMKVLCNPLSCAVCLAIPSDVGECAGRLQLMESVLYPREEPDALKSAPPGPSGVPPRFSKSIVLVALTRAQ